MTRSAIYIGSFDPLTLGHMDVLKGALAVADRLVIGIGTHPSKTPLFSFEDRSALIRKSVAELVSDEAVDRIKVVAFSGLAVEAAREHGAHILVRGIRDVSDLGAEMQMAGMNAAMAPELQTIFVPANAENRHITATLVRQIASMNGDISRFVPKAVVQAFQMRQKSL